MKLDRKRINNQIESGIVQGAGWTLKEHLNFYREDAESLDWVSYSVPP